MQQLVLDYLVTCPQIEQAIDELYLQGTVARRTTEVALQTVVETDYTQVALYHLDPSFKYSRVHYGALAKVLASELILRVLQFIINDIVPGLLDRSI